MKNTHGDNLLPITSEGVESFLSSKYIDGIGKVYARRLVEKFGKEALYILMSRPQEAAEVEGFGQKRISMATESLQNIPYPAQTLAFLYSSGISDLFIDRIFAKYRKQTTHILITDPYSMVEDVWQLSFFTADKIGRKLGIEANDPRRIRGALVTAVKRFAENGHLFAKPEEAVQMASEFTGIDAPTIAKEIDTVVKEQRLVKSRGGLYLPVFYEAEKEGAQKLNQKTSAILEPISFDDIPISDSRGRIYSPAQREAIFKALNSPVMVLTGGPGTGKTTVLSGIIDTLEKCGKKIVLAAPTGRAAKRMTALTGRRAHTIHHLLGYIQGKGYRNAKIDADVIIIDEGSMMEQVLFNHLLQALGNETRIILVGDADQLPAIGAGDVLRDMIDSPVIPVARLDENFRQTEGSLIASGARSINSGILPEADDDRDFKIIEENSVKNIHDRIISLIKKELPSERNIRPDEILVVTPQQIGPLGARQLNMDIQQVVNPEGPALKRGNVTMRLGDPVMQTANSKERSVYNGEIGKITAVFPENQTLRVTFSDGHSSDYQRSELNELVLAYATTVHKLQGSEVKYMIFPITMAHKPMLYRNLLYTGVSRASDLCVLVGEKDALKYAVENTPASTRNSNFKERLQ